MVAKVADIGLWNLRKPYPTFLEPNLTDEEIRPLLWVAPEHLRTPIQPYGTQKGDVYSFGIILQELILRCEPYENQNAEIKGRSEFFFPRRKKELHVHWKKRKICTY